MDGGAVIDSFDVCGAGWIGGFAKGFITILVEKACCVEWLPLPWLFRDEEEEEEDEGTIGAGKGGELDPRFKRIKEGARKSYIDR